MSPFVRKTCFGCAATWIAACAPLAAMAQDENDVLICTYEGNPGELATGAVDAVSGAIVAPVRVFGESAELAGPDDWRGDEGFFAVTNAATLPGGYSLLPPLTDIRFDFRALTIDATSSNLWYWDPTANPAPAFAPASQGQRLSLRKSPTSFFNATVDGAAVDVPGFVIDRTSSDGLLHKHLNIVVDDADEDPGTIAPTGIYVVALTVSHASAAAPEVIEVINAGMGSTGDPFVTVAVEYFESLLDGSPCPGDVDGNGQVGLSDLSILLSNFGTVSGASPGMGDLDSDGDVDLADLSTLLANFGATC